MFLRPPPFDNAGRLVSVIGRHPETGRRVALWLDDFRELAPAVGSLDTIAASTGRAVTLTESRRLSAKRRMWKHGAVFVDTEPRPSRRTVVTRSNEWRRAIDV